MDFISNFQEHETQNIIYSLVLIVFLSMGLIGRKNLKIQTMLKYAILWFLIIMVIVSLYSYRDHFNEFKNRVISEINPSKARKLSENQIIIKAADDHHFYLKTTINDQEIIFMIDTGASDIVMSTDDAKKIGIDIDKINFNKRYQTANGVVFGGSTKIDKIIIADVDAIIVYKIKQDYAAKLAFRISVSVECASA